MKILTSSIAALLISVATASVLDNSIYKADSVLYTAEYDIVDITSSASIDNNYVFIVQRILPDGDFKGIYILKTDDNDTLISTKVLENGKCTDSDSTYVYFGASDGIYTFDFLTKKAVKYGNITADVKAIQKHAYRDIIYVIADNQLNKITERGTIMKKVESVNNVQEIVLDRYNNIYLYEKRDANAKKFEEKYSKPKVIVKNKVIDVIGLPDKYSQMKLIRSFASTEGVLLLLDNRMYRLFSNGTSVSTNYTFDDAPTAYYLDIGLIQLYGHNKKLYQFNIIGLVLQGLSSAIGDFYNSIKTKPT